MPLWQAPDFPAFRPTRQTKSGGQRGGTDRRHGGARSRTEEKSTSLQPKEYACLPVKLEKLTQTISSHQDWSFVCPPLPSLVRSPLEQLASKGKDFQNDSCSNLDATGATTTAQTHYVWFVAVIWTY